MANIPPLKRLSTEEFKDQSSWIGRLLSPLNDFFNHIAFAFNNQLTFKDNLFSEIREIDLNVLASGTYPYYFKCKFKSKPVGLWVCNAFEVAGTPSTLTTAVYIDWEYVNGQIKVNNISGLTASKRYKISLVIIYG